jgi:2,5-diketo-D-gluconate reductase A
VFQIPPGDTAEAVGVALDAGYRHIDTAEMYENEKQVGHGVRDSGLNRSDVFITSKLHNAFHRPADARNAFGYTLADLDLDYVDLFLIHWPLPMLYGEISWRPGRSSRTSIGTGERVRSACPTSR